ncbi:hypothetical protein LQW54_003838 [Pestalotiopsis sp. IQ-011]
MAQLKKPTRTPWSSAYPGGQRPLNALIVTAFALFSAAGLYFMRIENAMNGVPIDFERVCTEGVWADGTPVKQTYTGIDAVDAAFRWLVPAFLTGPAGWDRGVQLEQIHFLVNFFAVVGIWNVEACRARNRGRALSYTAIWALFYQTVAGAAIIPLYYLVYSVISRKHSYLRTGREVPLGQARALLPAIVIGYLVPTVALYVPRGNLDTTQNLTALWQVAPLIPNVLLPVLAPLFSSTTSASPHSTAGAPADVRHLKRIYLIVGVVTGLTHLATLYICWTSENPQLSLSYVFLPNKGTWKDSTALGLHYIFQWDFWIIYASSILWCFVSIMDVERYVNGTLPMSYVAFSGIKLTLITLVAGPGAAMPFIWNQRENALLRIEENNQK